MRKTRYAKGNTQIRQMLVREAARLMYEEGVDQYYDAKHLAVKRIMGKGQKGIKKLRTTDLPSNGEISEELAKLSQFYDKDTVTNRLFRMRVTALEVMSQLTEFSPRLIGSVSTGKVRETSDIDLHLFTDCIEALEHHLVSLGWIFDIRNIPIRKGNHFVEYTHIYLNRVFPIELSVYPVSELRVRGRSSTDGKPIIRVSYDTLSRMLEEEHTEEWIEYTREIGKGSALLEAKAKFS